MPKWLRVFWFTLETPLATTIGRATVDATVTKTVNKIIRADLIVIDDIGMCWAPRGMSTVEAWGVTGGEDGPCQHSARGTVGKQGEGSHSRSRHADRGRRPPTQRT